MNSQYQISQLFIYPIKGLAALAIDESFVTERGLKYDRRWMLVDSENNFISQRSFSQLCLFQLEFINGAFMVSYNNTSVEVPCEITEGEMVSVQIWNDTVNAIVADSHINEFFSKQLKCTCRLVFMPLKTIRQVDENYVSNTNAVSFADGYPILVIGEESLNLINQKLTHPIDILRFRPNIVFTGGKPHDEDEWKDFTIENVELKGVKPCGRCMVVNINQQTGISELEPLSTLAKYRKFNQKVNFGQNVIALNEGHIAVGNNIFIYDNSRNLQTL